MGVGAIGAVGTMNFNPYIYNTNQVSAKSLNAISAIPDDSTVGGADASALVKDDDRQNINPLAKGQTANFADIFMQQISMSAGRQAELISQTAESDTDDQTRQNAYQDQGGMTSQFRLNQAMMAYSNAGVVA